MSNKLCFVIGPMRDMARLKRLATGIIDPIVQKFGYRVETPDSPEMGNIMDQVIATLDRADLVIADLTGNNPNVFYELGIRHCIGRPYIVVKEKKGDADQEKTPFDIAAYRYIEIDVDQVEAAKKVLAPVIENMHAKIEKNEQVPNPVTKFYTAPLTEMSPAAGLVLGYYRNFINPALMQIQNKNRAILVGESRNKKPIDPGLRENVRLDIVIPKTLDQARHTYIGSELVKQGLLKEAEFGTKPGEARPFTLYAWPDLKDACGLVDIPTTMNVMEDAIQRRLGQHKPDYNDEWNVIEAQEIARFQNTLDRELKRLFHEQADLKNKVSILCWPKDWPVSR